MKKLYYAIAAIVAVLGLVGCAGMTPYLNGSATSGTHVYLMRGMGPSVWSYGVDQIGAAAAKIPGVTKVAVYDYTQDQTIVDQIAADPPAVRVMVGGYSCGANTTTVVGAAVKRLIQMIAVIQASVWCGGTYLTPNVLKVQETYNPNFAETFGLGAYQLQPGPGFNPANLTLIDRPDCHPCADTDPDAQNDVLDAIREATVMPLSARFGAALGAKPKMLVRYHNQRIH